MFPSLLPTHTSVVYFVIVSCCIYCCFIFLIIFVIISSMIVISFVSLAGGGKNKMKFRKDKLMLKNSLKIICIHTRYFVIFRGESRLLQSQSEWQHFWQEMCIESQEMSIKICVSIKRSINIAFCPFTMKDTSYFFPLIPFDSFVILYKRALNATRTKRFVHDIFTKMAHSRRKFLICADRK